MKSIQRLWRKSGKVNHHRWKVISMCILAATTFWFFNALNKSDYTTTINFPIELIYPKKDSLMVVGELPKALRINVTGGGWSLIRKSFGIGTNPLLVRINAPADTRYLLGNSLVPLINDQITTFRLNSVITDTLHFHIEKKRQRTIKLVLEDFNPKVNHVVVDIRVDPDTIVVTGPESYVNNLADSMIVEVARKNITGGYDEVIDIKFELEQIRSIPTQVSVSFKVDPLTDQEYFAQVTTRNFPMGYTLDMNSTGYVVKYQVASSYQDSIGTHSIKVYADFAEMKPDSTIELKAQTNNRLIMELKIDSTFLTVIKER